MEVMQPTKETISSQSPLFPVVNVCEKQIFICSHCSKVFTLLSILTEHVQISHPEKLKHLDKPTKTYKYKCSFCRRQFNHINNLRFHERKFHSSSVPTKKSTHQCPLCSLDVTKKTFSEHFQDVHNIQIETENLEFRSVEEFTRWKESMENESKSKFVKERGSCKNKYFNEHYYVCHRSGYYVSEGKGIRRLKMTGSNKIDGICPAGFKVYETLNGKCSVSFRKTHVGHKNEVAHLNLSTSDLKFVASKIINKKPYNLILNEVRNNIPDDGLKRLNLLTKKDLYNIERRANTLIENTSTTNDNLNEEIVEHQEVYEYCNIGFPGFQDGKTQEDQSQLQHKEKEMLKKEFSKIVSSLTTLNEFSLAKELLDTFKENLKRLQGGNDLYASQQVTNHECPPSVISNDSLILEENFNNAENIVHSIEMDNSSICDAGFIPFSVQNEQVSEPIYWKIIQSPNIDTSHKNIMDSSDKIIYFLDHENSGAKYIDASKLLTFEKNMHEDIDNNVEIKNNIALYKKHFVFITQDDSRFISRFHEEVEIS